MLKYEKYLIEVKTMFSNCFDFLMNNAIESATNKAEKSRLETLRAAGREIQKSKAERDISKAIKDGKIKTTAQALAIVAKFDSDKARQQAETKATKAKTLKEKSDKAIVKAAETPTKAKSKNSKVTTTKDKTPVKHALKAPTGETVKKQTEKVKDEKATKAKTAKK